VATFVLNEAKMFSDIADGIAIVINSETGIYYGMNSFGTAVFENLLQGASTEDIMAAAKNLPDAPDDLEQRLLDFVEQLKGFEILMEGEGNGSAGLDAATLGEDGFALKVQEYSDAQELLLADPIHEVKTETGWEPDKGALETDVEVVKAKEDKIDQGVQQ
jgi:hypothetical protein